MTYAISEPLQRAVFAKLAGDPNLSALVGADIFDAPLPFDGVATPDEYITIGPERVVEAGSASSSGAVHDFFVIVHSNSEGFGTAKTIAGAVCDVLLDAQLVLTRGHVVCLRFLRAKAELGRPPEKRRISLSFRAFVEDNST